jgi:hypothetical protein
VMQQRPIFRIAAAEDTFRPHCVILNQITGLVDLDEQWPRSRK